MMRHSVHRGASRESLLRDAAPQPFQTPIEDEEAWVKTDETPHRARRRHRRRVTALGYKFWNIQPVPAVVADLNDVARNTAAASARSR